jgi:hypothetical protein
VGLLEEAARKAEDPAAAALIAEHEAARAAMAGQLDDAVVATEAAAAARAALDGPAAGAALARRHLAVLGWMRGVPVTGSGAVAADEVRIETAASTALELVVGGERERARIAVRDLATGTRPLPAGEERLPALGALALAAADLGDPALAGPVHGLLAPYANLACGTGYRSFVGVAAFHLGRLAVVTADWAEAERHLLAALRRYSALQARPWVAFTQAVLAHVLAARGRPSDREWVAALRAESRWALTTLRLRTSVTPT